MSIWLNVTWLCGWWTYLPFFGGQVSLTHCDVSRHQTHSSISRHSLEQTNKQTNKEANTTHTHTHTHTHTYVYIYIYIYIERERERERERLCGEWLGEWVVRVSVCVSVLGTLDYEAFLLQIYSQENTHTHTHTRKHKQGWLSPRQKGISPLPWG